MCQQTLKEQLTSILNLTTKGSNENSQLKPFFEANPECLPLFQFQEHHGIVSQLVFKQYQLNTSEKPDFLWFTKTTQKVTCIICEIKGSNVNIFNQDTSFASDFNSAYEQIEARLSLLKGDTKGFLAKFREDLFPEEIKSPTDINSLDVKGILIFGRRFEKGNSKRDQKYADKSNNGIKIFPYDALADARDFGKKIVDLASYSNNRILV